MKIENHTLAELVNQNSKVAILFEKHDIDFCCRGKMKLAEAVKNKEELEVIIARLNEVLCAEKPLAVDFTTLSLTALADYIVDVHHNYVKNTMPVILQHVEKVASKHGEHFPEMKRVAELFREVNEELGQHLMKEEMVLFPRIKQVEETIKKGRLMEETVNLNDPIIVMESEHDHAGRIMEQIKEITSHYTAPENACMTFQLGLDELKDFEMDLHKHVHLENNILFPKALLLLKNLSAN